MRYCFSNSKTLKLFSDLYNEKSHAFLSVRDLLTEMGYALPDPKDHALAFHSLIPKEARLSDTAIQEIYDTVLTLRYSLILKEEHLEHCFSFLASSQKNELLKTILINYLKSPLVHDEPEALWKFIGDLREKKCSFPHPISFVREPENSFLFKELSETVTSQNPDSKIINTWEIEDEHTLQQVHGLRLGSHSESLLGLCQSIASWKKDRKNKDRLWIPFFGEETTREYLELFLSHEGLHYKSYIEKEPLKKSDEFATVLERLRKTSTIALKERLALNETLLKQKNTIQSNLLENLKKIDKDFLLTPLPEESSPEEKDAEVYLFPFHILRAAPNIQMIGFCDNSYLSGESPSLSFSEGELELLYQGGFPLPRRSNLITYRKEALLFASQQSGYIYTSLLKQNLLSDTVIESVTLSEPQLAPAESYTAEIKINRLSATQLESFSQCPAKYFFLNRMRMRTPLNFQDSYALILGQSVHLALENACKTKYPFTLDELNRYYDQALKEYLPEDESNQSHKTVLTTQFQLIADRVERLEKTLEILFGPGKPILVEESFEIEIEGLKFTGKIDRVDLRNGKLVILDYKTGNVAFTPEDIRRGDNFQALLYILAMEKKLKEPLAGMIFYDLKLGELKRGVLIEEQVPLETKKAVTRGHTLSLEKFETLKADGIEKIKQLASEMQSSVFTPKPAADSCSYCEAKWMCRKAYGYV